LSIWDLGRDDGHPLEFYTEVAGYPTSAQVDIPAEQYRLRKAYPDLVKYDAPQAHWAALLRGESDRPPTAELALNTMLISEGIYQSSALGREVSAEEIEANSVSAAIKKQETGFGELVYD
jgi:predicted dehydrogenase